MAAEAKAEEVSPQAERKSGSKVSFDEDESEEREHPAEITNHANVNITVDLLMCYFLSFAVNCSNGFVDITCTCVSSFVLFYQIHCNEFGDVLDVNEYHIDDQLGAGSFATVYLCTRASDSHKYAVKVFEKSRLRKQRTFTKEGGYTSALDKVAEEVAIMKKLEHPNIVR
jgi:serine/threonine protein kinase